MSELLEPLRFPLHGSRLIEASAGTGKTWTIAALYVRLVLGHGGANAFPRPLAPEEVLVVTFTRAATEELRDRIRGRLTEAAAVFRGAEGDAFLRSLRDEFEPAHWPLQAWRLELAASAMDQAAVSTIHGWCQRMLRQHAFDSGTPLGAELEGDDRLLREEVARDYWRTFIQPQPAGVLAELQKVAVDPGALAAAIAKLPVDSTIAVADSFLDECSAWRTRCDELEDEARRACEAEHAAICEWFDSAMAAGWLHKGSYKPDQLPDELDALRAWAEGRSPCAIAALRKFVPANLRTTKNAGPLPDHAGLAALARFVEHHEQLPPLREPLLRHAAAWCARRLQAQKQRLGKMSYDDLLTRLHDALMGEGGATLAAVIRRQFPVAMIDEFQDTDPTQYTIFRRIFGETPGDAALLMIGDPKQAIYAFRGADIHAYLQARRDTAGHHYTLGTNFRSTAGLVAAVNALFERAEQFPDGAFLLQDEIPFQPVTAAGRNEQLLIDGQVQPALTLWQAADGEPRTKTRYENEMAAACASAIAAILSAADTGAAFFQAPGGEPTPIRAADVAILVRTGKQAALVRQALTDRHLKSVYLSDRESVFASAEARDLLCWLEAAAAPERNDLLRRAVATCTLALPLADLDRYARDEVAAEELIEQFRRYHVLWGQRGVLPMVRALLDDFAVASRCLAVSGGERILTNLLQLAELLQRAGSRLDGQQALLRELAERIDAALRGDPNEEHVLRLESDADLIRVVTMHKSKGLEYPLVFIPFACGSRPKKPGDGVLAYHDDNGHLVVAIEPDDDAVVHADRERLAEDLRLFYVALTRARHACWVGLAQLGKENKKEYRCELQTAAIGHLLTGGEAIEPPQLRQLIGELAAACSDIVVAEPPAADISYATTAAVKAAPTLQVRTPQRPPAPAWWIGSYSGLVAKLGDAHAQPIVEASGREATLRELQGEALALSGDSTLLDDPEAGIHRFPAGSGPGSFLHGLLEWAADIGFERVTKDDALRRDQLARRCNRRGWDAWVPALDRWLVGLLKAPLPLHEGSVALAELSLQQCSAEMEFWIEAHNVSVASIDRAVTQALLPGQARPRLERHQLNGMLKGFIDLVFEHDGRYYVVDYKSNWLGPTARAYSPEAMDAAVLSHRYELQYAFYTLALHRLLRSRLAGYDYERHVGGSLYLFLRGLGLGGNAAMGVHRVRPSLALIDALDLQFQNSSAGVHV